MKKRLDVLLVERGLAETRSQAQALVIAGLVPGYDKPGTQLDESVALEVGFALVVIAVTSVLVATEPADPP